ncbi:hypothetical protein K450DRAFT_227500 [Umbelopsis ramanniana AG]|uniref:Uncharacterized protein n=1 Tax=Umbelopsis ramanniana AG TaxID=1314678 RepID=A0AAD5EEQ0_UMBRA|nr:uncharacterized protein K450DRAFT_227500 [Umbelopsis ramanniana AG]KAI8582508.1 hypothetical protein K450DRAFT_227500 [Umbelopsis ramanniana AG]
MPDITKSLPTEEKHRKRSSKGEKKSKKHSSSGGLLNGTVDSVKKEAKRGVDSATKKSQNAVPNQVSDTVEQTKDKVSEGKDQLEKTTKDQAKQLGIPEHFLSTDFMQEAGFDDNDARKLMKAIMEYNQKSMMSSDSEAEQDNTADEPQSQGNPLSQEKPQPNGAQTPQTEKPSTPKEEVSQPENGSMGGLLENNVKVEPKAPEALLKDLVGKSVDKNGNVHGDDGKLMGKVTGDITDVEGKKVNEAGDVVDEDGKVFGKIKPVDPTEVAGINVTQDENGQSGNICLRHGDSDLIIKVDATKTGISFSIHIPRPQ